MLTKIRSYGLSGIDAYPVTIEVDVTKGVPSTAIVGLPDNAVKESRERVRSAIKNSGFDFKSKRITVNLSPADTKKAGAAFDLAIALGYLISTEQFSSQSINEFICLGELSLDGSLHPIPGTLAICLSTPSDQYKGILVPEANAYEAAVSNRLNVYPVKNLKQAVGFLSGAIPIEPFQINVMDLFQTSSLRYDGDFSDVKGQAMVKRGLEVAAAGSHNCLLIGPPGSGKTMLSKRAPTILPEMSLEEALETTKIHSISGLLPSKTGLITTRPFRSPHHTSSDIALIGGGSNPKPGEVTLAHNGILFLDELPEFNRNVLESLRQPLEDHCVTVSRASRTVNFPSKFMLIASMNPCPCGFATDPTKECQCSPYQIQRYMAKISGPLLDRIDIHLDVPALPAKDLFITSSAEPSQRIKERCIQARDIQRERFKGTSVFANAFMKQAHIKKFCAPDENGKKLLHRAIEELKLSARAHDKILKVARTIADLQNNEQVKEEHIAEAIQYRCLDRT
ncbi:MAG TPA: YifB family Mg chelatase-like AAA ATPase [Candidatus Omnitrophota bacterium]|nr:YifB family Mg chelatase-like AAA ATPase [Candidatus Omnitrophota bacterium]